MKRSSIVGTALVGIVISIIMIVFFAGVLGRIFGSYEDPEELAIAEFDKFVSFVQSIDITPPMYFNSYFFECNQNPAPNYLHYNRSWYSNIFYFNGVSIILHNLSVISGPVEYASNLPSGYEIHSMKALDEKYYYVLYAIRSASASEREIIPEGDNTLHNNEFISGNKVYNEINRSSLTKAESYCFGGQLLASSQIPSFNLFTADEPNFETNVLREADCGTNDIKTGKIISGDNEYCVLAAHNLSLGYKTVSGPTFACPTLWASSYPTNECNTWSFPEYNIYFTKMYSSTIYSPSAPDGYDYTRADKRFYIIQKDYTLTDKSCACLFKQLYTKTSENGICASSFNGLFVEYTGYPGDGTPFEFKC